MKHFYLPGAPLNLTCDKALTGNVLMMKLCWLMCCHTEVSKGSCERLTFCQPNPSWTSTSPLPLEYRPHRHHHQNNYSHHHRPHVILSATVRLSHSSITFLPVCFWTDYSLSSSHLSFSLFLSLSIFSFISPNRWFTLSGCLCFALLAISLSFSLQKVITHWAHQPGVNSLHPLTDESEKGAVAMLTTSSEQKHINGYASH